VEIDPRARGSCIGSDDDVGYLLVATRSGSKGGAGARSVGAKARGLEWLRAMALGGATRTSASWIGGRTVGLRSSRRATLRVMQLRAVGRGELSGWPGCGPGVARGRATGEGDDVGEHVPPAVDAALRGSHRGTGRDRATAGPWRREVAQEGARNVSVSRARPLGPGLDRSGSGSRRRSTAPASWCRPSRPASRPRPALSSWCTSAAGRVTCDMPVIVELCSRSGVALIEDCVRAHGATVSGRRMGSFGDA
jgi:hypothetical protein